MIVCRVCGHGNPDDATFCESCKSFLEFSGEAVDPATVAGVATPLGTSPPGRPAPPDDGPEAVKPARAMALPANSTPPGHVPPIPPAATTPVDASMPRCPRCGTANEPSRVFCKYCGEALTAMAPVTAGPPRARFGGVDPRLAVGAGAVLVAVLATVVFAVVLNGAKPAATTPPPSDTSAPPTQVASGPPSVSPPIPTVAVTSTPSISTAPTVSPAVSTIPSDSGPSVPPVALFPKPNTTIVFYAARDDKAADIHAAPARGGVAIRITTDSVPDSYPKWSPDGTKIVFDSRRVDGRRNIWIIDADRNYTRLSDDDGNLNAQATWSPDGQQIAWVHSKSIWVMNVDGNNKHPLTTGADDTRPTWSAASGLIAYMRTLNDGHDHEIWTVGSDTAVPGQVLVNVDAGGGREPSYSPDGLRLAYAKIVKGVLRIVVANADGSGETIITNTQCPCEYPTWSPDGQSIAFQGGPKGNEQIFTIPAAGGSAHRATDGKFQNLAPGWAT